MAGKSPGTGNRELREIGIFFFASPVGVVDPREFPGDEIKNISDFPKIPLCVIFSHRLFQTVGRFRRPLSDGRVSYYAGNIACDISGITRKSTAENPIGAADFLIS